MRSTVRAILVSLVLVVVMLAGAQTALAVTTWTYTMAGGNATITGYTGTDTAITVPSTIDGYPVVAIGSMAFYERTSLTSVTIPDSVTSIGERAFYGCMNLTSARFLGNAPSTTGADLFGGVAAPFTVYHYRAATGFGPVPPGPWMPTGNPLEGSYPTAYLLDSTFTITPTVGAGGSITPATPQTVTWGGSLTLAVAPGESYHITEVLKDGVSIGASSSVTFTDVVSDHTLSATFAINTYTLHYTAGSHGSVVGSSTQVVISGASGTAVTAKPAAGYHFVSWSDGRTTATRTDSNVTGNHTISATFAFTLLKTKLSITSDRTTSTRGHSIYFHGVISPNVANNTHVTVWMRKSTTSKWTLLSTRHTFSSHHWSYTLSTRTRSHGTYYVQVRYAGSSTLTATTSSSRKIVIK